MKQETSEKVTPSRLFVPLVALTSFATFISNTVITLLLSSIALTFLGSSTPASVGIAGQISTINYAAEAIFAVLMGFLAIRFRHKSLFLSGVLLIMISAVGNFFAPTLFWMQVFFALEGIGSVIISIIGFTMIGDLMPPEKKAKALGFTVSANFLGGIVGPTIIYFTTGFGGWRYAFLLYALPISALCLAIASLAVPSVSHEKEAVADKGKYVSVFKRVFLNKSASLCLLGMAFMAGPTLAPFAIAFFQKQFAVTPLAVTYIVTATLSLFFVGSIVAGQIANRFGCKRLTILGVLMNGVFQMTVFFMPNLYSALAFTLLVGLGGGITSTSIFALAIDQVPQSRGTMMSMTNVFMKIGWTVAPAIAGLMLVLFASYQALGLAAAVLSVIAVAFLAFSKQNPSGV